MKKVLARKKDNKGFSLVELIVVILIMAVIAVALAPQVMKWVGKSKESTDQNNIGQIESAVNAGVADFMAQNNVAKVTPTVYVIYTKDDAAGKKVGYLAKDDTSKTEITRGATTPPLLEDCILDALNGKYPLVQSEDAYFWIKISDTGSVTVKQSKAKPTDF